MRDKLTKTCLLAATTVCAAGALALPAAAAQDSYWCKLFPKFCSDEATPGGTQNAPTPAETMSPSAPASEPAPMAAPPPAVEAPPPPPPPAPPPSPEK
jgi:hypothetical protein